MTTPKESIYPTLAALFFAQQRILDAELPPEVTLTCYQCGCRFVVRKHPDDISDTECCGFDDCDGYDDHDHNEFGGRIND